MTLDEAFELHDLLGNLPGVRLVNCGMTFDEAADLLGIYPIMVETDWRFYTEEFQAIFPDFAAQKRDRDERRVEAALALLDREISTTSKLDAIHGALPNWLRSMRQLAGLGPEHNRRKKKPPPLDPVVVPRTRRSSLEVLEAKVQAFQQKNREKVENLPEEDAPAALYIPKAAPGMLQDNSGKN